MHEVQYKLPTFMMDKVQLTYYKPNPTNIARIPDGKGKPRHKDVFWDNQVAELLHRKRAQDSEKERKEKHISDKRKKELEEKLKKIYS